jgi:hypothetical protein
MRLALALVVLAGCSGPKGDKGDKGDPGQMGPMGSPGLNGVSPDGGTPSMCTPGNNFCDGNRIWTCTRSGLDAYGGYDCSSNTSVSNPYICATTNCAGKVTACCRSTRPQASWTLTAPIANTGDSFGAMGAYASFSDTPAAGCAAVGMFTMYFGYNAVVACLPQSTSISLSIDRTMASPGQTITLPNAAVNLSVNNANVFCSAWTGTVKWDTDAPAAKVEINTTCSDVGTTLSVAGTFNGDK